ncbi:MAG: carboxymuconolactone decarboxylase family protein [Alphaproteobacteria bacterium]
MADIMTPDARARGYAIQKQLWGDKVIERRPPGAVAEMLHITDEALFGTVWTRPGLDIKTRSLCCITTMTALGKAEELIMHLHAAHRIGVDRRAITEAIIQAGFYAGIPCGVNALRVCDEVWAKIDAREKDKKA